MQILLFLFTVYSQYQINLLCNIASSESRQFVRINEYSLAAAVGKMLPNVRICAVESIISNRESTVEVYIFELALEGIDNARIGASRRPAGNISFTINCEVLKIGTCSHVAIAANLNNVNIVVRFMNGKVSSTLISNSVSNRIYVRSVFTVRNNVALLVLDAVYNTLFEAVFDNIIST